MINANKLLRSLNAQGHTQFTYRRVTDLLNLVRGKATPKDIHLFRKELNKYFEILDKKLEKLEIE